MSAGPDENQPGRETVVAEDSNSPLATCMRYQFLCTVDDKACNATEVGKWKWDYTAATPDEPTCDELKATPGAKHVFCCSTDKCNAPDPKLDPDTIINEDEGSKQPAAGRPFDANNTAPGGLQIAVTLEAGACDILA